jgi:hypothetical protein
MISAIGLKGQLLNAFSAGLEHGSRPISRLVLRYIKRCLAIAREAGQVGAEVGFGAHDYLDDSTAFADANIAVCYHRYENPIYGQL